MIRALVILVCSVAPTGAVADPQPQRIEEAFSHDQIDRTLWMTERLGARVDPGGGQLKIIVPKGPPGRPPAGLKSKFRMEGDFDARAEYRIASWRRPKKQSINVEIVVEGPGGAASVIRTNHAEVGSGNSFWYGPADFKRQGAWKQVSTKDTSGWWRLKRSGGELQFFVSGPGAANFRQLGAVDYGTAPITSLSFRVSVPETESAVQVAFGKIEIEADRVVGPPRPAGSIFGPRAWLGGGVALVVAAALGAWFWRRTIRPPSGAAAVTKLAGADGGGEFETAMKSVSAFCHVACSGRLPAAVRGAVLALLAIHGAILALSIPKNSVTYDEFTHLPVGISYWHRGEFWPYHHNPPLVRLIFALPAVLLDVPIDYGSLYYVPGSRAAEYNLGRDFMLRNRDHYLRIYAISRLVVAAFSVLGGYLVFRWSRELFGNAGGLVSLALWTFSPNVLAHAGLATPDLGATVIGFLATYAFWRYLRRPSFSGVFLSGILLGLTEAAKFSFIVLPFAWVVLAAIKAYSSRKGRSQAPAGDFSGSATEKPPEGGTTNGRDRIQIPSEIPLTWKRMIVDLGAIFIIGLVILNDVYLGEGTGCRLGSFEFRSKTLTVEQRTDGTPAAQRSPARVNRFRGTFLGTVPVPLPAHYVLGFDDQMFDVDSGRCYAYLRGELRRGEGWWYYYLYCALVKGPLGTLFLVAAAALATLLARSCRKDAISETTLILPMLLFFVSVSSQTGLNAHFRYVLPAFPFAFVFVGRLGRLWSSRRYIWKVFIVAALAGNAVSVLRVHPNYLTYFNEAAGGPLHGLEHLADSNIDWGQGLVALHDWLVENAPGKRIRLAYFGTMYPEVLGIDYELPPFDGPVPGLQAVSAYYLLGISMSAPNGEGSVSSIPPGALAYYRRFEPIAVPGNSIYVYDLSVEEVNKVRAAMALPPFTDHPSRE